MIKQCVNEIILFINTEKRITGYTVFLKWSSLYIICSCGNECLTTEESKHILLRFCFMILFVLNVQNYMLLFFLGALMYRTATTNGFHLIIDDIFGLFLTKPYCMLSEHMKY